MHCSINIISHIHDSCNIMQSVSFSNRIIILDSIMLHHITNYESIYSTIGTTCLMSMHFNIENGHSFMHDKYQNNTILIDILKFTN